MKDNFSSQSDIYYKYRPGYPDELFQFILSFVREKNNAWDCATGNGQSAASLAKYFTNVYATDISQKQLDHAKILPNIHYSVQPAEQTNFPSSIMDLITISQGLHWLNFESFYKEVRRVAKPGACIAAWMYSLPTIEKEIDNLSHEVLYKEILGSYWDKERKHVDQNYRTIPFPFDEKKCPVFHLKFEWTLDELAGYFNSWSAVSKFISINKFNPVEEIIERIRPFFIEPKKQIDFAVTMRLGIIK